MSLEHEHVAADLDRIFPGDSELARRMRVFDWSQTPIGSVETWPQNLRIALSICLTSRFAMQVWWGPSLTMFYNDAYISFLGAGKHPAVLGRSGRDAWSEIWHTIGPMIETVQRAGVASWSEDILMFFQRALPREEVYVTFSFSPVFGEDGHVDGVYCACQETTEKIVGSQRLDTLRKLGIEATVARSVATACQAAGSVLKENPSDVPFAAIYVLDELAAAAHLAVSTDPAEDSPLPASVQIGNGAEESGWPLASVLRTRRATVVDLHANDIHIHAGPWPELFERAIVLPIRHGSHERLAGLLVAGVSPRRPFDEAYRTFLELLAGHLGSAIVDARAYEEERQRAEALAALDRAKTLFFTNISHEFRTPLTLMLGPLEDELRAGPDPSPNVQVAHRNALRLLKLVNTLLDFSRIEAGRMEASYEPTDLGSLTAELASVFRSAVEQAGLRLVIDCPNMAASVYVDREMWEKIVLNLLSNALKFTFDGVITVSLRERVSAMELAVSDTGVGIAAADLPRVFERFHRLQATRSRTHEGTGIGLALVQELVKLHGGEITAESVDGRGTTFTVSIPTGKAHLPEERIAALRHRRSTTSPATAVVDESLSWVSMTESHEAPTAPDASSGQSPGRAARILLADDNADMRNYIQRILAHEHEVMAVADGEAALAAARRHQPDLVLADVMMPGLDGFGLVARLRADPHTHEIPIVLVSARAGEEARIEGMEQGADDYLIKPFSARELLARVNAHVRFAQARKGAAEVLRRSHEELERRVAERTKELRDSEAHLVRDLDDARRLQAVSSEIIRDDEVGALYERIMQSAIDLMQADTASLQVLDPERRELRLLTSSGFHPSSATHWERVSADSASCCGIALRQGQRMIIDDTTRIGVVADPQERLHYTLSGICAVQSTPLVSRDGTIVGMLSTHWREPHRPSDRDLGLLDILARQAADLIERTRHHEALRHGHDALEARVEERTRELQTLLGRLVTAQDGERKRIGRDVHDQLGQSVTALRLSLEALVSACRDNREATDRVGRTLQLCEELDRSIDVLVWSLRPSTLDHLGLPAALRELVRGWSERFHVAADYHTTGLDVLRLAPEVETHVYRIAQEALHNIYKHARASHVDVSLERRSDRAVLTIEDDGVGFDINGLSIINGDGLGLKSLHERAALIGAALDIEASPDGGTVVLLRLPVDEHGQDPHPAR